LPHTYRNPYNLPPSDDTETAKLSSLISFLLQLRHPLISPLFPYTTLFRSRVSASTRRTCGCWSTRPAGSSSAARWEPAGRVDQQDRKSTRLNSSHRTISYAVFCLKKKNKSNGRHAIATASLDPDLLRRRSR